jgi:hypothetical protein
MPKNFKYINAFNRFVSNIRNNRLSNWIKELFSDVPILLYADATEDYVASFTEKPEAGVDAEITLVNNPAYGKDYHTLWWFQRKSLLKKVNLSFKEDENKRVFRFKRVIIYNSTAGK